MNGNLKFSNQNRSRRNSYPSAATGPLSNEQKAALCILARSAYDLQFSPEDLQSWRHSQQLLACGKSSLCDCTQADFLLIKAHLQRLAGEEGEALRTENRHSVQDVKLAMFKLRATCAERGVNLGYARTICRSVCKCELDAASHKQIWRIIFTIRNRRKPIRHQKPSIEQPVDEPF